MTKKSSTIIFFLIILGRLSFLFLDAHKSHTKQADTQTTPQSQTITQPKPILASAHNAAPTAASLEAQIQTKTQQQNNLQDLTTLQTLYAIQKDPAILQQIIQKQAQNYQFNEALANISTLISQNQPVDANLHLHVYLNSNAIAINTPDSIKNIFPILQNYLDQGKINTEEAAYYEGLIQIRYKNYPEAIKKWAVVKDPIYQPIIQNFVTAINSYDPAKAIPRYYQDGLVALAALKNGYFNIARKIALETVLQDEKYILPYQILAYSNFLTNNWENAIQYFLQLANFDETNAETYKFLIGVSYYRNNDPVSSTLYITQTTKPKFQTDKYRYLLLDYLKLEDTQKLAETRENLLNQSDLSPSDFFQYFYTIFYKGYFSKDNSLYEANQGLSDRYISKCIETFSETNDICRYGALGKHLLQGSITDYQDQLLTIAETYKQSYLYHILGDQASTQRQKELAKSYYVKALSLSQDSNEKNLLVEKVNQL